MDKWICDDRKTPEDWKKEWEFVHRMSDEEFDQYIKKLKEKEAKEPS